MIKKAIIFLKLLFFGGLKFSNKLSKNIDNWKEVFEKESKNFNLKPNQLSTIGESLFLIKLEEVISDLDITEKEKLQLQEIATIFQLSENQIKSLKDSLNKKAVEKLINKVYDDKILTDNEMSFIIDFGKFLNFEPKLVEQIRTNLAYSIFKTAVNKKLIDKKLSPHEETELSQTLRDLKLDDDTIKSLMPQKGVKDLAYAKLLWQLEKGIFMAIPNVSVVLKKGEECYLVFSAKLLEQKVVSKGYKHGGHGVSFRVAKGIRYSVGSGRSIPVKETITIKHQGELYLTNSRIIFSADKHSFNISFNKLLSFDVYCEGISFIIDNWSYILEMDNEAKELFALGLASSIRNYFNDENEILIDAKKEIKENETLINVRQ